MYYHINTFLKKIINKDNNKHKFNDVLKIQQQEITNNKIGDSVSSTNWRTTNEL